MPKTGYRDNVGRYGAASDGAGSGARCVADNFLSALVGSFATPAAENPTVAMIEAAFRHHGMDARYINCEVEPAALRDAARGARAMGVIIWTVALRSSAEHVP